MNVRILFYGYWYNEKGKRFYYLTDLGQNIKSICQGVMIGCFVGGWWAIGYYLNY